MTEPQSPPVRVTRSGLWRYAPLTREQVRRACLHAEAWVRGTTWKDVEDLIHATAWLIGEQLQRPTNMHLAGMHDIDDMPVVRVHVSEFVHHIAFRDTRMLENNTMELLLGDARVEAIVEQRMLDAKSRQKLKAGKTAEFANGKIR